MTRRSQGREVALQLLYQRDLNPRIDRAAVERFAHDRLHDAELVPFCLGLYDGVVAHGDDIDARLTEAAENWPLVRMAAVDRNVLRLGAYELLHSPDTRPSVALSRRRKRPAGSAPRMCSACAAPASTRAVHPRSRRSALSAGVTAPAASA